MPSETKIFFVSELKVPTEKKKKKKKKHGPRYNKIKQNKIHVAKQKKKKKWLLIATVLGEFENNSAKVCHTSVPPPCTATSYNNRCSHETMYMIRAWWSTDPNPGACMYVLDDADRATHTR